MPGKPQEIACAVEFRLLGTVEVVADGAIIEFGSARQRILLAMLLLHANELVPLTQLIEAMWDERPPATAESQVQTCISALRRRLKGVGADQMIVTRPVGYAIMLPDDALDIKKFEQLASQGRAAASRQQAAEAARVLRAALAQWHGDAALGVESRLVQTVATRLNESRIRVLEECIELELGLGRHHDLTGELGELTIRFPLRERLQAQHMLALYRSARQVEALESFREVRQRLMDELGIDPGEELRELQQAILRNDPAIDLDPPESRQVAPHGEASAGGGGGGVTPRQLPAAVADFTGREDALASIVTLLSPTGTTAAEPRYLAIVTLTGKGGAGKTALAIQLAHAVRQHYPDGQLFAHLREAGGEAVSAQNLLDRFLRVLGMAPAVLPSTLAEREAAYRSILGDRRVLIVLDDAQSVHQVLPLIPGSPACAVIATSRHQLSLPGATHFEIGDMDEEAAVSLLARIAGAERVNAEPAEALTLVRLCGCLPLALRIVAAKLAMRPHWRIAQMVHRMTDENDRLDELFLDGAGIRATLALSYNSLPPDARRLLILLSELGAADFSPWVCAPLLDIDLQTASDLLDTLVDAYLVEVGTHEDRPPRFRLHDLVRIYAVERLAAEESMAARTSALQRVFGCWLSLAAEAHRRRYGGDFTVLHGSAEYWTLPDESVDDLLSNPLSWFRDERGALVATILQAAQAGFDEACWDLAMTSVALFESEYLIDDWRKTHEAALEVTRRAGNLRGEAAMLCSLGSLAAGERLGEAEQYLNPALQIFDKLGDKHGSALVRALLGYVDRVRGSYPDARARYRQALAGFDEVGDLVGKIDALASIAQIEMELENFGAAEQSFNDALAVCGSLSSPRVRAQTEYKLAEFLLRKGELERAERAFSFALDIVRAETDVIGEAYATQGLGVVHGRLRKNDLAEFELRGALELARHAGDKLVHGRVLLACADHYAVREELDAASAMMDEALVVFSELGPAVIWRIRFLELKARIDEKRGRVAAAAAARQMALELVGGLPPALSRVLSRSLQLEG